MFTSWQVSFRVVFGRVGEALCFSHGSYVDEAASVAAFSEEDGAVYESVEGVVLADANVQTGMVNGATLALQDVTGLAELAAKDFHSESFAF